MGLKDVLQRRGGFREHSCMEQGWANAKRVGIPHMEGGSKCRGEKSVLKVDQKGREVFLQYLVEVPTLERFQFEHKQDTNTQNLIHLVFELLLGQFLISNF